MRKNEIQQIYYRFFNPVMRRNSKHTKPQGTLIWNSYKDGTYYVRLYGPIKERVQSIFKSSKLK